MQRGLGRNRTVEFFLLAAVFLLSIAIFATYQLNARRIATAIKGPNFQIHQLTNDIQKLKVRVSELEDEMVRLKGE